MKEPEKWIFHKGSACGPTEAIQPELNPEWMRWRESKGDGPFGIKLYKSIEECLSDFGYANVDEAIEQYKRSQVTLPLSKAYLEAAVDFVNNGGSPYDDCFVWSCSSCDMSSGEPCPHCNFSPYF